MSKSTNNRPMGSISRNISRHIPKPSTDDWHAYDIAKRRIRKLYADSEAKIDQLIELLKL